jgi:hypothetical protein
MRIATRRAWVIITPFGYKITDKDNHSCVVGRYTGGIFYTPGKWVQACPGCGPLCVFPKREDAMAFLANRMREEYVLWMCEYNPSIARRVWIAGKQEARFNELPLGTALANGVKLLRKVNIDAEV